MACRRFFVFSGTKTKVFAARHARKAKGAAWPGALAWDAAQQRGADRWRADASRQTLPKLERRGDG
jgi:hypothetical protein